MKEVKEVKEVFDVKFSDTHAFYKNKPATIGFDGSVTNPISFTGAMFLFPKEVIKQNKIHNESAKKEETKIEIPEYVGDAVEFKTKGILNSGVFTFTESMLVSEYEKSIKDGTIKEKK